MFSCLQCQWIVYTEIVQLSQPLCWCHLLDTRFKKGRGICTWGYLPQYIVTILCISPPPPPFFSFLSLLLLYKPCLKLSVMSHVFGLALNVSISLYNGTRDERPPLLIQLFLTPPFPPDLQVDSPLPYPILLGLFLKVFPIMFPFK